MSKSSGAERIIGFDLLRGLCALGVASYHMLKWQQLADLHDLGLYGVYIFFALSGASMTVAYGQRFRDGFSVSRYLAQRYLRLAPLFVLVTVIVFLLDSRLNGLSSAMLGRLILNCTFVFGFTNPGSTSIATGAWSLGIEFIFYLLFPLFVAVRRTRWFLVIALGAFVCQVLFVNQALANRSLSAAWTDYTQFGSFMGYFAAGVLVGTLLRQNSGVTRWAAVPFFVCLFVVATQSGDSEAASLVGVRGVVLSLSSIALVAASAWLVVPTRGLRALSTWLGDISYALYLLHPLVFGLLASRHLLQATQASSPRQFVFVAIGLSLTISTIVHRSFEKRLMSWGKKRLDAIRRE